MSLIETKIKTDSDRYKERFAFHKDLSANLESILKKVRKMGISVGKTDNHAFFFGFFFFFL